MSERKVKLIQVNALEEENREKENKLLTLVKEYETEKLRLKEVNSECE